MDITSKSKPEPSPKASGSAPLPDLRRGMKGFLRGVQQEMKRVTWPSRKETTRLTGVVLGVCGLITIFLALLSGAFDVLMKILLEGGK